jgi:dienelactone hydrolase
VKTSTKTTAARRKELYSLLGDLPDRKQPISSRLIKTEEREHYFLEYLVLDLNGVEPVPAYFLRPKNATGPFRTVLYNHAHGGGPKIAKRELINGRDCVESPPYGEVLAKLGYASICIDHWNFGDRHCRPETQVFKETLWKGQVLWGMMVYDTLRTLDYLCTRPDVDRARIGTLGLSMGSTMAWWTAALDERIKVCVDLCCMSDFEDLIETKGLDEHSIYYYVPGLLKHFTSIEINELTAPRAHLSLNGNYDPLTPPRGLDRIDRALKKIYSDAGKPEAWKMYRANHGHFETAIIRAEVLKWLEKWL